MDLRSIKKEVRELPCIKENVKQFQKTWIKPIQKNSNMHLPSLQEMSFDERKEINTKIKQFHEKFSQVSDNQLITDKLHHYSRYLVELKLHEMRGHDKQSKFLTNQLLDDGFLNMKNTIIEVQSFQGDIKHLVQQYEEINELVNKEFSLEEAVLFMELPHRKYLNSLQKTATSHAKIVRDIGRHFVPIAHRTSLKKAKRR